MILGQSDARDGQALLNEHFASGSGAPAYVLVPIADQSEVVKLLDADRGIESVSVVGDDDEQTSVPVGEYAGEIDDEIRSSIEQELADQREQVRQSLAQTNPSATPAMLDAAVDNALANAPTVDELVADANPFAGVQARVVDGDVLLEATLVDEAVPAQVKRRFNV